MPCSFWRSWGKGKPYGNRGSSSKQSQYALMAHGWHCLGLSVTAQQVHLRGLSCHTVCGMGAMEYPE